MRGEVGLGTTGEPTEIDNSERAADEGFEDGQPGRIGKAMEELCFGGKA